MGCKVKKITIIGLGLIGGSIVKAFHKYYNDPPYIHAVDRDLNSLKEAHKEGMISGYSQGLDNELTGSEIIFISTPVHTITGYMEKALAYAAPECIITDTGSTKLKICEWAAEKEINYIGGHPMTGSEKSGYTASKEFLFENAYYLLTPAPCVKEESISLLKEILSQIGALPYVIDAALHDSSVAAVSHVPHIIAASLVNMVDRLDNSDKTMHTLAAGGFRDITRIASSDPDMWYSICMENKDKILDGLEVFKKTLSDFSEGLKKETADIRGYFQNAKDYRDSFQVRPGGSYMSVYQIFVDVCDKPGMIATVATLLSVNKINIKNIGIVNSREYESGVMQIVFESLESMEKSIGLLTAMNFTVYRK